MEDGRSGPRGVLAGLLDRRLLPGTMPPTGAQRVLGAPVACGLCPRSRRWWQARRTRAGNDSADGVPVLDGVRGSDDPDGAAADDRAVSLLPGCVVVPQGIGDVASAALPVVAVQA